MKRRQSGEGIVYSAVEVKKWVERVPGVEQVRPARCSRCGAASRPLGAPLVVVGHGLRDRQVRGPAEVTREVLGGSATAASIKTARTGFTTSRRVHHLAEGLGIELVMGNQIDGQLGSLCSVAFGSAFELTSRRAGELSNFLDMTDDLLAEPLQIHGGELVARSGPGLGAAIDPDKLARYRQD